MRNAMKDLLAEVEDGSCTSFHSSRAFPNGFCHAINAFYGSLDAALALHDTVLPGWDWGRQWSRLMWVKANDGCIDSPVYYCGEAVRDNPARALLIAILKALIAQEATQ